MQGCHHGGGVGVGEGVLGLTVDYLGGGGARSKARSEATSGRFLVIVL